MKSNTANNKYYNRDMEGFYGTKKKKKKQPRQSQKASVERNELSLEGYNNQG